MSDERIHGRSTYLKYKCRCDICVEDARVYRANRKKPVLILDGELLIERLTRDGRISSVDTSARHKWKTRGMEVHNADRWAVKLGYHPYEIWGNEFYRGCNE